MPNHLHITCCFIAKNKAKFLETIKTTDFREEEEFTVTPTHLAYVPSKLLTMKCSIGTSAAGRTLYIDNAHAHLTLGFAQGNKNTVKSVKPKNSNDLLEACFDAEMLSTTPGKILQKKLDLPIGGPPSEREQKNHPYDVYVMKLEEKKEDQLNGLTKVVR